MHGLKIHLKHHMNQWILMEPYKKSVDMVSDSTLQVTVSTETTMENNIHNYLKTLLKYFLPATHLLRLDFLHILSPKISHITSACRSRWESSCVILRTLREFYECKTMPLFLLISFLFWKIFSL